MTRKQFLLTASFAAKLVRGADVTREAPELLLTDTNGKPIRLSLLRGKVVVLEFMLTTCPHCQSTAKLMSRLQKEYGPRGFQAISLPFNDDAPIAAPGIRGGASSDSSGCGNPKRPGLRVCPVVAGDAALSADYGVHRQARSHSRAVRGRRHVFPE